MAQPPSIGKKTPPSILQRFTIYSSMFASSEPLLTSFMLWGFGGKSKSGKGPPTPKKSPKNTDNLTRTRKNTNHSANTDKDGKDIEFRVLVKQGHVVYELLFFMVWNGWVRRNLGGPLLHQKEVNFRYSQKLSFQKKNILKVFLFKRGPLHFAVIRYGAFGQTIPCQGWKVSRWAKKKIEFRWITN